MQSPNKVIVRSNLTSGNPVRQHGIAALARSLTKIAADQAANQQTP